MNKLVITGHSLGAGVASILALLLRRAWRDKPVSIRCVAFSPPGGTLSKRVAEAMRSYTMSPLIEDDWVSRFSLSTLQLLRDEVVHALVHSDLSKAAITRPVLCSGFACLQSLLARHPALHPALGEVETGAEAEDAQRQLDSAVTSVFGAHAEAPFEVGMGLDERSAPPTAAHLLHGYRQSACSVRARPMWPPGQLVLLSRTGGESLGGCCGVGGTWRADELNDARQLQRIVLTPSMIWDHFPDRVLGAIQSAVMQETGSVEPR